MEGWQCGAELAQEGSVNKERKFSTTKNLGFFVKAFLATISMSFRGHTHKEIVVRIIPQLKTVDCFKCCRVFTGLLMAPPQAKTN